MAQFLLDGNEGGPTLVDGTRQNVDIEKKGRSSAKDRQAEMNQWALY